MKNITGNILNPKLTKSFQNQKQKISTVKEKLMWNLFWIYEAILGFTRMSVRGLNKVKRELGFVLMALNIRKVVAQRAENNQKFIKDNFYIISIEIVFFTIKNFMSRTRLFNYSNIFNISFCYFQIHVIFKQLFTPKIFL